MRWRTRILLGAMGLLAVAAGGFFGASEWTIRRRHAIEAEPLAADRSEAGVKEGARLVRVLGCLDCHGAAGQGKLLADQPLIGRLRAPALAPIVQRESDAVLARTLRHGVDRNGATLWAMPARATLADDDTARLLGFLRTLRPSSRDVSEVARFGPLGRLQILRGGLEPSVHAQITAPKHRPADTGAYFVGIVCAACHDLYQPRRIGPVAVAPPLAYMAAAYDDDAFRRLLQTGRGMGPRDLGEMRQAAQTGLAWLSDDEITAIKAYLTRMAAEPPPPAKP